MKRERREGGRETGSGRETGGKRTYTGRFFRELDFSGREVFPPSRISDLPAWVEWLCLGAMLLCDLYVFGYHRYV